MADNVQLRSLRITADFDAAAYVAGMRQKVEADQSGIQSAANLANAVQQSDAKVSNATRGWESLKRQFVEGEKEAQDFDRALNRVVAAVEKGQAPVAEATKALEGMYNKYGRIADVSSIVARGQVELGSAVAALNTKLLSNADAAEQAMAANRRLAAEARATQSAENANRAISTSFGIGAPASSARDSAAFFEQEMARIEQLAQMRASQNGANFAADLNSRLGIGGTGNSARDSASVFMEADREAAAFEERVNRLKAVIDPVSVSQMKLNQELEEYSMMAARGAITTEQLAQAQVMAQQRHTALVASVNPAGTGVSAWNTSNIAAQFQDIGVTAAMGMSPLQIMLQQGTQLSMVMNELKGSGSVIAGLRAAFMSLISPMSLATMAFVGLAAVAIQYFMGSEAQTKTLDEALQEHTKNIKAVADAYGLATEKALGFSEAQKLIAAAVLSGGTEDILKRQISAAQQLREMFPAVSVGNGGNGNIGVAIETKYAAFSGPIEELIKQAREGKVDMDAFTMSINEIGNSSPQMRKAADEILRQAQNLKLVNDALSEQARIQRQLFNDRGPGGFLLSQGPTATDSMGDLAAYERQQKVMRDRMMQSSLAVTNNMYARSPEELAQAARDQAAAQYNDNEDAKARALRVELAGVNALAEAYKRINDEKRNRSLDMQADIERAQLEVDLIGKTTDEQARLRMEYEKTAEYKRSMLDAGLAADEKELQLIREKTAELSRLNQLKAAGDMLRDQSDQMEQLQLEANLIGASAEQRARATAALQAEQQIRQAGISTMSAEAAQIRANADAMASWKLQIEQVSAGWTQVQQAGMTAIDQLVAGIGDFDTSIEDVAKNIANTLLGVFKELAIANPLKNAIYGTNLPTLSSIGGPGGFLSALAGGRPATPAMPATTMTSMMTVTAGTVMLNGFPGLPGVPGLPGASTSTTTLSSFLGIPAANGVRPSIGPNGIINSPVASAPVGDMAAYAAAIRSIESGSPAGNYQALGPVLASGDRAYGAYQVMGSNIPSWTKQAVGTEMTSAQFLASPQTQDAVFQQQFSASIAKYGNPQDAASVWFTGRPQSLGGQSKDILGTSGNQYVSRFNSELSKLSSTTSEAATQVADLGTSSTDVASSLTKSLGSMGTTVPTPSVPTATPQIAPVVGQSSGIGGFFSSFFSMLFGGGGGWAAPGGAFADGTDYAPGGWAMVGERGPELVNLPRGSQVVPNHAMKRNASSAGSGGRTKVDVGVSVDDSGNLKAYIRSISEATASQAVASGISTYDQNHLPGRMKQISNDPYALG